MPRMSFGTGHHATTYLMTEALLELDLRGRRGLDAGSGTGVLAIAAAKCCGAAAVVAVDIDEWAEASCRENAAANGVADRVRPLRGDVGCASGRALRLHSGQHQPQHPHGLHAPLRRDARAGRRPAAERLPSTATNRRCARAARGRRRAGRACGRREAGRYSTAGARREEELWGGGIVLHTLKYGDSSLIVHLLTDTGGRRSYMVQGCAARADAVRKPRCSSPCSPWNSRGLESPRMQMDRFREVRSGLVFRTLPFDVRKPTVALFMAEVPYRLVKESERNEALFDFVWGSVGGARRPRRRHGQLPSVVPGPAQPSAGLRPRQRLRRGRLVPTVREGATPPAPGSLPASRRRGPARWRRPRARRPEPRPAAARGVSRRHAGLLRLPPRRNGRRAVAPRPAPKYSEETEAAPATLSAMRRRPSPVCAARALRHPAFRAAEAGVRGALRAEIAAFRIGKRRKSDKMPFLCTLNPKPNERMKRVLLHFRRDAGPVGRRRAADSESAGTDLPATQPAAAPCTDEALPPPTPVYPPRWNKVLERLPCVSG